MSQVEATEELCLALPHILLVSASINSNSTHPDYINALRTMRHEEDHRGSALAPRPSRSSRVARMQPWHAIDVHLAGRARQRGCLELLCFLFNRADIAQVFGLPPSVVQRAISPEPPGTAAMFRPSACALIG